MILIPLAVLVASPVHKKADADVNREDGDQHVDGDTEDRDAREEPNEEADTAEKLCHEGEECKWRGNSDDLREELHRPGIAAAAKPAEYLLGSMRKKDDS